MAEGQKKDRLDSWKEIAEYLGRDVRTVIRWEKEKGLPVHRVPGGKRSAVFSYSDEIDTWMFGQPEVASAPADDISGQPTGALSETPEFSPPDASLGWRQRLPSRRALLPISAVILLVAGVVLTRGWETSSTAGPPPLIRPVNLARADYDAAGPRGLGAEDFNGDRKTDLVFTATPEGQVVVLLGDGYGSFERRVASPTIEQPERLAVGDFNSDGRPDVAVTSYFGGSQLDVLLGQGDGSFRSHFRFDLGGRSRWIAVADLNRDGKLDLAVSASVAGKLIVLFGKGDGTFREGGRYDAERDVAALAIADFNGDGWLDVAAGDYRSAMGKSVTIYINKGDGTLASAQRFETGQGPLGLTAADLNHDRRPDLITANFPVTASVLLGSGPGTFAPAQNLEAGRGNGHVEAGDLDRDGNLDLVVLGEHSNTLSVLLGNGDGTFQPGQDSASGDYPDAAVIVDLDGDHKLDVAVANINGNSISVFLNRSPELPTPWIRRLTRIGVLLFD